MFKSSSRITLGNEGITKVGSYVQLGGEISGSSITTLNQNASYSIEGFHVNNKPYIMGAGLNNSPTKILQYDAGRILVTGSFTAFKNTNVDTLIRINTNNASLDNSFLQHHEGFDSGFGGTNDIGVFSDGKILLSTAGSVTLGISPDEKAYANLIRLNANGTVDTTFSGTSSGFNDPTYNRIQILSDNKFIIYGIFQEYSGQTVNTYIQRFNANGTIDGTFNEGFSGVDAGDGELRSITIQSDDKIVVVGNVTSYDTNTFGFIFRLNEDGTYDGTFDSGTGFDLAPYSIHKLSDDSLIVSGFYSDYNGTPVNGIVKLNPDGTINTTFNTNIASGETFADIVLNVDANNKLLCTTQIGGELVRINPDGTTDETYPKRFYFGDITTIENLPTQYVIGGNVSNFDSIPQSNFIYTNVSGDTTSASGQVVIDATIQNNASSANKKSLSNRESTALLFDGANGITNVGSTDVNAPVKFELGVEPITKDTNLISETLLTIGGNNLKLGGVNQGNFNLEYVKKFYSKDILNAVYVVDNYIYAVGNAGAFHKYDQNGIRIGDSQFIGNKLTNGSLLSAIESDGNNGLYLGGAFTRYNNVDKGRIVKVNIQGAIDPTFDTGFGFAGTILKIKYDSTLNKFYVGGGYTSFNISGQARFVRLHSDGSKDTSFNIGTGFNNSVYDACVQADGKVLVGGLFTTYTGATNNRLIRLNTDGKKDTTFNIGNGFTGDLFTRVNAIAEQADGKILVGGRFTLFTGSTANRIIRLNANGTKDTSFAYGTGFNNAVSKIVVQPDDKILVAGSFDQYSGVSVNSIVRLNPNGSLDATFNNILPYGISDDSSIDIFLQPDDKIVVVGSFTTYSGTTQNYIVRLNSDGTLEDDNYSNKMSVNNGTFEYAADYSADYTLRSLVDKEYVDSIVSGSTGVTTITANNGLTKIGDNIRLGGTLTGATSINSTGNTISFNHNDNDSEINQFRVGVNGIESIATNSANNNSNAKIVVSTPANDLPEVFITTLNGGNSGVNSGKFNATGITFTAQKQDGAHATSAIVSLNDSGFTANSNRSSSIYVGSRVIKQKSGESSFKFQNNIAQINELTVSGGFDATVQSVARQTDGKYVFVGDFARVNGERVSSIVRLNADGSIDRSFNMGTGLNSTAYAVELQADGKILVGGDFSSYNGYSANKLMRLNTNGTIDTTFNMGNLNGFNSTVYSIEVLTGGTILVGGNFTTFSGASQNRLIRLLSTGLKDTSFNVGTGFNAVVRSTSVGTGNTIVVGGEFTTFTGTTQNRIVKLNFNGTKISAFNIGTGFNNRVYNVSNQPDGKIVVSGYFTQYTGATQNKIVKLNPNGTKDTGFFVGTGFDADIEAMAVQSDGKIILGGFFSTFTGSTEGGIIRLNPNGSKDATFVTGLGTLGQTVSKIRIQTDGKILIGGAFRSYNTNIQNKFTRVTSLGVVDPFTDPVFGRGFGANATVSVLAKQPDGKILVGGLHTVFCNQRRAGLARVNLDLTPDSTFDIGLTGFNGQVAAIAVQTGDSKIIVGGQYTTFTGTTNNRLIRLNPNGSKDSSFNIGSGFGNGVLGLAIQPDGKVIAGGAFTTFTGATHNRLLRLNADGTRDTGFNVGTGFNATTTIPILQPDGKVIVLGTYTTFTGSSNVRIIRLNANGTKDSTFATGAGFNSNTNYGVIQADGKVIVGGSFTSYSGVTANRIVRLHPNGKVDATFQSGTGFDGVVNWIYLQPDGKIVCVGTLTTYNGVSCDAIVRLNSNGTRDFTFYLDSYTNFDGVPSGTVNSVVPFSSGSVNGYFIGGATTAYDKYPVQTVALINDFTEMTVTNLKGVAYAADYSANFTDRTLVDKRYVDSLVSGSTGTTIITASNGLTKIGDNIVLGGTLTGDTIINTTGANDLYIQHGTDASIYIVDRAVIFEHDGGSGNYSSLDFAMNGSNKFFNVGVQNNGVSRSIFIDKNRFELQNHGNQLIELSSNTGNTVGFKAIGNLESGNVDILLQPSGNGTVDYDMDRSSYYNNRSLVDKEYVDRYSIQVVGSNTVLSNASSKVILVDSSTSGLTITLPDTPTDGKALHVKDMSGNAFTNAITINGNGKNIDGTGSASINTSYGSVFIVYSTAQDAWFSLGMII